MATLKLSAQFSCVETCFSHFSQKWACGTSSKVSILPRRKAGGELWDFFQDVAFPTLPSSVRFADPTISLVSNTHSTVSHSIAEAEVIHLTAGLRMEDLPALQWCDCELGKC